MKQFFTRRTEEASVWCKTCGKKTIHKITNGRPQYCIPCFDKLESQHKEPRVKTKADQTVIDFKV